MNDERNMSTKFRSALRNEVPRWLSEGVISEEAGKRLSALYQLEGLKEESSRLLSTVIFTIGALLVGGGVISFVAANWERISDRLRLGLLFATLLALHAAGYWLWQVRGWRRLGRGLIFCACVVFGANIGLIAQILHIRGEWYGAFGAWAIGSLAVAWAIRSSSVSLLVLLTSFVWFVGFYSDHARAANLYPPLLAVALIPLAWIIRSRLLYGATLVCFLGATFVLATSHEDVGQVLLTMTAGGLFTWVLGEVHLVRWPNKEFSIVARGLGLLLLAIMAHIGSVRFVWTSSHKGGWPSAWALVFLVLTGLGAVILFLSKTHTRRIALIGVLVAGALLCGSSLLAMSGDGGRVSLLVFAANLAALILGSVAIWISLLDERRSLFWAGSLYVVVLVFARFLEYETSLLMKSAAFIACGAAVIFAGIQYERYLRRRGLSEQAVVAKEVGLE